MLNGQTWVLTQHLTTDQHSAEAMLKTGKSFLSHLACGQPKLAIGLWTATWTSKGGLKAATTCCIICPLGNIINLQWLSISTQLLCILTSCAGTHDAGSPLIMLKCIYFALMDLVVIHTQMHGWNFVDVNWSLITSSNFCHQKNKICMQTWCF